MAIKRYTRQADSYSKSFDYHGLTWALFLVWYNFCRRHSAIRVSPAMQAGLDTELHDEEWIVELIEASTPPPGPRGPYRRRRSTRTSRRPNGRRSELETRQIRKRARTHELKLRILDWAPRSDDTEGYVYPGGARFSRDEVYDASLSLAAAGMLTGMRIDTGAGSEFAVSCITLKGLNLLEYLRKQNTASESGG